MIALRTSDWPICDNLNHTAGRENNPAPYQHERLREYFVALDEPVRVVSDWATADVRAAWLA